MLNFFADIGSLLKFTFNTFLIMFVFLCMHLAIITDHGRCHDISPASRNQCEAVAEQRAPAQSGHAQCQSRARVGLLVRGASRTSSWTSPKIDHGGPAAPQTPADWDKWVQEADKRTIPAVWRTSLHAVVGGLVGPALAAGGGTPRTPCLPCRAPRPPGRAPGGSCPEE